MRNEDEKPNCCGNEREPSPGEDASSGWSCCEPGAEEATEECPCGSVFKKHRGVLTLALAGVALAFLISQVGGILGIIAFIRTL